MRTIIFALIFISASLMLKAQENNLIGTWNIVDLQYITEQGTQNVMNEMKKAGNSTTDFYFMEKGKFKQTSNMSGSGTLDTYEGTWKTSGDKLIITLNLGGRSIDVDYTFELKENTLILTRSNPQGTMKIVNTFKKKQA